ncbi:restriction endonuclease subunit S [Paraburkholderia sp. GAS333]|uniref:restriction endonuclease subunit S n=1 Tax=Paraburkholderia sp. GAS333 TaxID=3156279 RepID=UPI003D1B25D9
METPTGWQCGELLNFLELQRGVDLPLQDRVHGEVPIFGSNGLLGSHNASVADGPGVITGRSGTIGKLFYTENRYWPLNTSLYVKNFKGNLPKFVYYKLDEVGLAKFSTGTGVPTLNRNVAHKEVVVFPPLPEQNKIAAILTAVDDKLNLIARQIEATQTLKRGLMQTLFNRGVGTQDADGRWVPHAEFKDSELGEIPVGWEVQPLASISQETRARNAGILDDALLCGVLKDQGLIPMRERVKGATTDRCRVVESNAFAYNPMRINIGSIARNLRDHAVMVSPDYVVFATKPGELMYSYLDHFRRSDEWQRFVGRSGDGGVRIRIYYDDLAQLRMKVPPLEEQARIVEVLDCVSKKLNNLTTKQREFQTLKRGLMQKLLTGEWRVKLEGAEPLAA